MREWMVILLMFSCFFLGISAAMEYVRHNEGLDDDVAAIFYQDGWDDCVSRAGNIDYYHFIVNIDEIPYELKSCAVSHYLKHYADHPLWAISYDWRNRSSGLILFNDKMSVIDCEELM